MLPCLCNTGDSGAVELLPESRWKGASAKLPTKPASTEGAEDVDEEDAAEAAAGAEVFHVCVLQGGREQG